MIKEKIQKYLAKASRQILTKYKPEVIGITGSIGKTSAKEAIFAVVSSKYETRKNIKNYNNEFGLPFTIIGTESPKRNLFGWLRLFRKILGMLNYHGSYPKVLVLEMGIDRPGDMDYLVNIARPNIAVMTTIGISHVEYFNSEEQILQEKAKILKYLDEDGYAILNYDDPKLRSLLPRLKSHVLTFGKDPGAGLRVSDYKVSFDAKNKTFGASFKMQYKGQQQEVFLPDTLGWPHVQACLAGVCAGLALGMGFEEACRALKEYQAQPGRLRIIPAIQDSYLIDDTYNSAPLSTKIALDELMHFPAARKIAVLGDMLELGKLSLESHENIAQEIITERPIDYFIAVGPEMKNAANRLKMLGFNPEHVFVYKTSVEAIAKTKELLSPNTAVLVKGSQGMRMEKISREIMAEPEKAKDVLCRQDPDWIKK
jgi:UDP-N-acetylmuramoyl-tripeptide--D-alanyl-D-alanine ligase